MSSALIWINTVCMSNKIYEAATDSVLYIAIWENKRYVDWEDIALL